MKNEINTQCSSPSSPQEQAEPRLEAGEGLDVTACSVSSFDWREVVCSWYGRHESENERGQLPVGVSGDSGNFRFCHSLCMENWGKLNQIPLR